MKNINLLLVFAFISFSLFGQKKLTPITKGGFLEEIKIKEVTIYSENENQVILSIKSEIGNDKSYAVLGEILDVKKETIAYFSSTKEELASSGETDITIKFKAGENFKYSKPTLKTYFVKLHFANTGEGGDFDELLSKLDKDGKITKLFDKSFVYELNKDWRVPGNAGMTVTVPIIPIGKAKEIVTKTKPIIINVDSKINRNAILKAYSNKRPLLNPKYRLPTSSSKPQNNTTGKPSTTAVYTKPMILISPTVVTTKPSSEGTTASSISSKGPTNKQFIITDKIMSDIDFSETNLFSLDELVFRDANINSGFYYYYPTKYSLKWDAIRTKDKYNLKFNFGTSGRVTVTATLSPKISRNDKKILTGLLVDNIKKTEEQKYGVKKFTPLPLTGAPDIKFEGLSQFGIQPEDVSVSAPSKLDDPILMTFTTQNINDLTNMLFNDIGLYGKVIIHPDGEDMMGDIEIPFSLKIDDPETYGKFELTPTTWRKGWQNPTDYPLVLSYLHALVEVNGQYQVYSWNLENTEVPEHAKVTFKNHQKIPSWIDKNETVKQIWMEYVTQPCNSCNELLIEEFIKGYVPVEEKNVRVRVQNALEFTGADVIYLTIRSYQGDAGQRSEKEFELVEIENDGQTISRGPLYLKRGEAMDFEYKLEVVMPDGKIHKTPGWIKHKESVLAVGAATIKEHISYYKGKEAKKKSTTPSRRRGG